MQRLVMAMAATLSSLVAFAAAAAELTGTVERIEPHYFVIGGREFKTETYNRMPTDLKVGDKVRVIYESDESDSLPKIIAVEKVQ